MRNFLKRLFLRLYIMTKDYDTDVDGGFIDEWRKLP